MVAKALLSSFLSSVYVVVRVTSQKRPTINLYDNCAMFCLS